MIEFTISSVHAGWAHAELNVDEKRVAVTASYALGDELRDFADAVASLAACDSATTCWFQEPGEIHWRFTRIGTRVRVELLSFDDKSDGETIFDAETDLRDFGNQVLRALLNLRASLGTEGYAQQWHYPFPEEACRKLQQWTS